MKKLFSLKKSIFGISKEERNVKSTILTTFNLELLIQKRDIIIIRIDESVARFVSWGLFMQI